MIPKQALRRSALFSQLSDKEIDEVAGIISEREIASGETVIREGEEGYSLFILEEGLVDVLRNAEQGQAARITELGEGAMFGEMSFIEHGHLARTAGVVAHGRVKVLELRFDALERLAETDPVLGVKLYRTLAISLNQKLKGTTDHLLPLIAGARLAALGQMTANIAHELGNPLAVVQSLASAIAERGDDVEERGQWARKIAELSSHCGRVISALRAVSRDGASDPLVGADPAEIVRDTQRICEQRLLQASVRMEILTPGPSSRVRCRPVQLSQAVLNLLGNSIDAICAKAEADQEGNDLKSRWIRVGIESQGGEAVISVEDSGLGIPAVSVAQVFRPFYTTKGVGAGTGLGLSLSRQLVEANGGTLVLARPSGPTRFEIRLPAT